MSERDDAIRHLADALKGMERNNALGDTPPTIRLYLAPIGITGADISHCHSIDLTSEQVEALATGVDALNDMAADTEERLAQRKAELMAWMGEPVHDRIESGEWDANSFVTHHWQLAADLQEVFLELDPRQITKTVLDHRQVDMPRAIEALDDVFGEIADPYADEDDA